MGVGSGELVGAVVTIGVAIGVGVGVGSTVGVGVGVDTATASELSKGCPVQPTKAAAINAIMMIQEIVRLKTASLLIWLGYIVSHCAPTNSLSTASQPNKSCYFFPFFFFSTTTTTTAITAAPTTAITIISHTGNALPLDGSFAHCA